MICTLFLAQTAWVGAHDSLGELIQHTCQVTVGSKHIDLVLELTFFEQPAARERKRIDANGDGAISSSEKETYLAGVASSSKEQVALRVAGQAVDLLPLYDPELDLPAMNSPAHGHHRLRLFLFAPTPASLKAGDSIVVEDRLWSGSDSIVNLKINGRDGCRLETESAFDPARKSHSSGVQTYTIRCAVPPLRTTHPTQIQK